MPSPPDNSATAACGYQFEQQAAIETLPRLIVSLARALGEAGVGGATIQSLLADAVRAECVSCRMSVSGTDLNEAALAIDAGAALGNKLERLRLGYCARNTCSGRYYLLRFRDQTGVQWDRVWARSQALLSAQATGQSDTDSIPQKCERAGAWWYRRLAQRPMLLGLMSVFLLAVFVRSGCHVPGLSPKGRVFIVISDPGISTVTSTNRPGKYIAR
jgi:hypothetical protein